MAYTDTNVIMGDGSLLIKDDWEELAFADLGHVVGPITITQTAEWNKAKCEANAFAKTADCTKISHVIEATFGEKSAAVIKGCSADCSGTTLLTFAGGSVRKVGIRAELYGASGLDTYTFPYCVAMGFEHVMGQGVHHTTKGSWGILKHADNDIVQGAGSRSRTTTDGNVIMGIPVVLLANPSGGAYVDIGYLGGAVTVRESASWGFSVNEGSIQSIEADLEELTYEIDISTSEMSAANILAMMCDAAAGIDLSGDNQKFIGIKIQSDAPSDKTCDWIFSKCFSKGGPRTAGRGQTHILTASFEAVAGTLTYDPDNAA